MATHESSPSRPRPDVGDPHGEHLVVDPALLVAIGRLELLGNPARCDQIDGLGRGRVEAERR
jgi:hypothetical protein